jgi:hypothetical protein
MNSPPEFQPKTAKHVKEAREREKEREREERQTAFPEMFPLCSPSRSLWQIPIGVPTWDVPILAGPFQMMRGQYSLYTYLKELRVIVRVSG